MSVLRKQQYVYFTSLPQKSLSSLYPENYSLEDPRGWGPVPAFPLDMHDVHSTALLPMTVLPTYLPDLPACPMTAWLTAGNYRTEEPVLFVPLVPGPRELN